MTLKRPAQFSIPRVEMVYLGLPGQDFGHCYTLLNKHNLWFEEDGIIKNEAR